MHTRGFKGLYAITDEKLLSSETFLGSVEEVLKGGASIVQYRHKNKTLSEDLLISLRELCHHYHAYLFINDDPLLAQAIGADGVHVGKDDGEVESIKERFPTLLIGVSCYDDLSRAIEMEKKGIHYVAFGACFPSLTKPEAKKVSLEVIKEAKERLTIPVCVIGGITRENVSLPLEKGADMVAVISDLWVCGEIEERARRFSTLCEEYQR